MVNENRKSARAMEHKALKGPVVNLSSGKQKIKEKFQKLEEQREALFASINAYVEKSRDAVNELLQVDRRTMFFARYQAVSQQLERAVDTLFLLQANLTEESDTDDESQSCETDKQENSSATQFKLNSSAMSLCTEGSHKIENEAAVSYSLCNAASMHAVFPKCETRTEVCNSTNVLAQSTRNSSYDAAESVSDYEITSLSFPVFDPGPRRCKPAVSLGSVSDQNLNVAHLDSSRNELCTKSTFIKNSHSPACSTVSLDVSTCPTTSHHEFNKLYDEERLISPSAVSNSARSSKSSFYSVQSLQGSTVSCSDYSLCNSNSATLKSYLDPQVPSQFCLHSKLVPKCNSPLVEPCHLSDHSKDRLLEASGTERKHLNSPSSLPYTDMLCTTSKPEADSLNSKTESSSSIGTDLYESDDGLPNEETSWMASGESKSYSSDALTTSVACISELVKNGSCEELAKNDLKEATLPECHIPPPSVPIGYRQTVKFARGFSKIYFSEIEYQQTPSDFYVVLFDLQTKQTITAVGIMLSAEQYVPKVMKGPFVQNAYCVIMSKDQSWHRAKITRCISASEVEVELVDFGGKIRLPLSDLYSLDPNIAKAYPASTVQCCLRNVEPLLGTWSPEAIEMFKRIATRNELQAFFHPRQEDGKYPIDLYVSNSEVLDLNIAEYLVAAQCAVPAIRQNGSWDQDASKPVEVHEKSAVQLQKNERWQTDNNSTDRSSPSSETRPNNKKSCWKFCWDADIRPCPLILNKQSRFVFVISAVVDPGEFYVHIPNENSFLMDDMSEQMNEYYSGSDTVSVVAPEQARVGTCWSTRYSKDSLWYRARIVNVHNYERDGRTETTCTVQHVDFGTTEEVTVGELRPLTAEFAEPPAFAVRCSLFGIGPINESWEPDAICRFKDLTGFEKTMTAEIDREENSDLGLSVLMWGSSDTLDVLVNRVLVEEGFAVYVLPSVDGNSTQVPTAPLSLSVTHRDLEVLARSMCSSDGSCTGTIEASKSKGTEECDELAEWDPMRSDYDSLRNSYAVDVDDAGVAMAGYKAQDERYICKFFRKYGHCKDSDFCRFQHISPSSIPEDVTLDRAYESVWLATLQLPAEDSLVYVQVSAAYNPSHFYVVFPLGTLPATAAREAYTEDDPLVDLQGQIADHYGKSRHAEDLTLIPAVGAMVAVEDERDGHWRRARVCVTGEDVLTVLYVDSGHGESVPRYRVRSLLPQFLHLPAQAVECFMKLQPKGNKAWSQDAMSHFRNLTEEKILLAKVLGIGKSTAYVELYMKKGDDDVDVANELVASGHATAKVPQNAGFPIQYKKEEVTCIPG